MSIREQRAIEVDARTLEVDSFLVEKIRRRARPVNANLSRSTDPLSGRRIFSLRQTLISR